MPKARPKSNSRDNAPHADVAARIRGLREAAVPKVSQIELGRRIGVSQSTMFRYETGEMLPGAEALAAMAKELGTTERFIVTGGESSTSLDRSSSQLPTDELVEQVIAREQCTDEEATALRSVNWKVAAGNYDYDFLRDFLIRRRLQAKIGRSQAPAVDTKLPDGIARMPPRKKR